MAQLFKDKEELDEFLHNLGIEYRFSCYEEKNPDGCNLLGQFFSLVEQDHKKAFNVYKHSCDTYNYGKSCNEVGAMKVRGYGTKEDIPGAMEHFKKSCSQGYANGCFHLGQMISGADEKFTKKNNIQTNPQEGFKLLEKACDLGCADACFSAHSYVISGVPGIAKDLKKAFDLAKKGCDSGYHFDSCENLMIMYRKGIGTFQNPKEAERIQEMVDHYRETLLKQREMNLQRPE